MNDWILLGGNACVMVVVGISVWDYSLFYVGDIYSIIANSPYYLGRIPFTGCCRSFAPILCEGLAYATPRNDEA
jgi:hypothetical protein